MLRLVILFLILCVIVIWGVSSESGEKRVQKRIQQDMLQAMEQKFFIDSEALHTMTRMMQAAHEHSNDTGRHAPRQRE